MHLHIASEVGGVMWRALLAMHEPPAVVAQAWVAEHGHHTATRNITRLSEERDGVVARGQVCEGGIGAAP